MDEACACEKPALTLRELEAQITELAGHLNAANFRWLSLIAEFDRREGWAQDCVAPSDQREGAATQNGAARLLQPGVRR